MREPERGEFQYSVFVWGIEERLREQQVINHELFRRLGQMRQSGQTSVSNELRDEVVESVRMTIGLRGTLTELHSAMERAQSNGTTFEEEFQKSVDAEMQELSEFVKRQQE